MTNVWITFKLRAPRQDGRKTDVWDVWTIAEDAHLGQVRWHAPWRKYCFFVGGAGDECVFEQDCLRLIAEVIEYETRKHREEKSNGRLEVTA